MHLYLKTWMDFFSPTNVQLLFWTAVNFYHLHPPAAGSYPVKWGSVWRRIPVCCSFATCQVLLGILNSCIGRDEMKTVLSNSLSPDDSWAQKSLLYSFSDTFSPTWEVPTFLSVLCRKLYHVCGFLWARIMVLMPSACCHAMDRVSQAFPLSMTVQLPGIRLIIISIGTALILCFPALCYIAWLTLTSS